jgi:hypothetical protein
VPAAGATDDSGGSSSPAASDTEGEV